MEKLWLEKSYPSDIPHEINADKYTSLAEIFQTYTTKHSSKVAYINMGQELTYRELHTQAMVFASYLQNELGLQKGDKFAIMIPNCLQYPIALFGALIAGLTVVNVNPLYTARELEHQLKDSEAKAIIIVENFASTLEKVIYRTPIKHTILTQLGDCLGPVKGTMVNLAVKYVKKMVPPFKMPKAKSFKRAMALGARSPFKHVDITGDDLAFLQYTGGTTGVAKGAMLSHRNMVANINQAKAMLTPIFIEGEELIVTALPLYHIFALTANCLMFLTLGAKNLLITNPRDMKGFVNELSKYPFTAMSGVNTLFNGLLNTPEFSRLDFSTLKLALGGGMSVHKSVADKWLQVTKTCLLEGYGLTETSPIVTVCPYYQDSYNGSIGMPVPSTEIKLIKDDGTECEVGEKGELWVKGPQVMQGYYKREEATAEVIKDGWLATGDIATMDEFGLFRIVDRKKDMINVSGFNVFPNEIEEVITQMNDVVEAAAIGVPHPVSGETIKVFVVVNNGVREKDIIAHCKQHLTNYKVPKLIEFRDELPKSNVGKILRKDLR
ncbi:AMP-binding protein [Thalassotalea aquiviva]|uniref:AMP-binding protein n=1 Tax=Thalassotalea aquiviva TaxID=3242415 RepID=UPI00352A8443